jgi:diguanylate cyclase (GGDEF)-like protein/PAS domain S-box-containing protein
MGFSSTIAVADGGLVPLKVGTETSNEYLRGYLQVYEDKDGVETFETVQPKTFHTVQQAVPNFGFSQSTYWIRFALVNDTPESLRLLLELRNQLLDFIDFFITSSQNPHVEQYSAGVRAPFDERASEQRYPLLTLNFAPHEQKTLFVRVRSGTPVRIPVSLFTTEGFFRQNLKDHIFTALFYAVLIFLIIYNLFAWSILKQSAYLYYILMLLSVGIYQLAIHGFVPQITILSQPHRMAHLFVSAIGFVFIFNIIFVRSFMDSRPKFPVLYRILDIFLILAVFVTLLYVSTFYIGNMLAMIYGPIVATALLIIIGLMWHWGESQARYLFLAHVSLPVVAVLHVGTRIGLIPFTTILDRSIEFGYLWHGMFFSLALADRYSVMQRGFQRTLENRVAERSAELVQANESLQGEILERKRIEQAIENAKQEWEHTFDTVPDLVAIIDANHVIQRINKTMAAKIGVHPRDAIGMRCYELCHGTDHPFHSCPLVQSLSDGREHAIEFSDPRLRGTFFVTVTPLQSGNHQVSRFVHVARDVTERKTLEEELHKLATTDSLTNVWNRRYFIQLAERELDRMRRYKGCSALMMIDLDHFKTVNDTHGHDVGDEALRKIAEMCKTTLRYVDIFARYGGEEFVALLPETGLDQARVVAERLRGMVAGHSTTGVNPPLFITLSIGITLAGPDSGGIYTLLKEADMALYEAKKKGRNRVEVFDSSLAQSNSLPSVH